MGKGDTSPFVLYWYGYIAVDEMAEPAEYIPKHFITCFGGK